MEPDLASRCVTIQMNRKWKLFGAILSCGTVYYAAQGGSNLKVWGWNLNLNCVTFQMKATEQYLHVILFIMLHKVSVCDNSNESY